MSALAPGREWRVALEGGLSLVVLVHPGYCDFVVIDIDEHEIASLGGYAQRVRFTPDAHSDGTWLEVGNARVYLPATVSIAELREAIGV